MPIAALYRRIRIKVRSSDKETYLQTHASRAQLGHDTDPVKRAEAASSHPPRDDHQSISVNTTHAHRLDYESTQLPSITQTDSLTTHGTPVETRLQQRARVNPAQLHYNSVPSDAAPINIYAPSGSFANANNTVFSGQVNMYDIMLSNQPVLQRLIENGKPEAIHDSSHREYPPRCSQNTRVSLRNDILEWRGNPNRQKRMRWYMGPPAIGKSAIAQSVAEELERTGHLGGSFFFSRPAQIDDPATVIPTLAYQLAMKNDLYKQIVTRRLADDLLILDKNRSTQFNKLIIEPLQAIATADPSANDDPMLIILDGLDECNGKVAQCEIVQLIFDHVGRVKKFPLLWLICSRPEWHLRTIISDVDFPAACEKREIDVDDEEAQADARHLLETELTKIQNEYADCLPEDWPLKEDLDRLFKAASGHLGFASFMARFIGDTEADDPVKQFHICIRMVSGLGVDHGTRINPLEALDRLYHRILSDMSPETLLVTMRILSFSLSTYSSDLETARDHANFLRLTQTAYNGALKQLHSIVYVPTASEASSKRLHFYHASFTDFLRDPIRSGKFHLSWDMTSLEVAVQCFQWLSQRSGQPSNVDDPVFKFTRWVTWQACRYVPANLCSKLMDELMSFDFGSLQDPHPPDFAEFIYWLYAIVPSNNLLIRLSGEPMNIGVRTLALEYKMGPSPFNYWVDAFFRNSDVYPQDPLSLHFLLGVATQIHVHLTGTVSYRFLQDHAS